jgi:hypothetical protein
LHTRHPVFDLLPSSHTYTGALVAGYPGENAMGKSKTKPEKARRESKPSNADDSSEKRQKIAETAYYKAEGRGFAPGHNEIDWLEAEKEVDGVQRAR